MVSDESFCICYFSWFHTFPSSTIVGGANHDPILLCASEIFLAVGVVDILLPPATEILRPEPANDRPEPAIEILRPGTAKEIRRPMCVLL